MAKCDVELWVLVDEDGNHVAHHDVDQLADLYDEAIGGDAGKARRVVKVTLSVPMPEVTELTGVVPELAPVEAATLRAV